MKSKLISLYIYLTDECNLKCSHCWQAAPLAGSSNYSFLKFDDCKQFLDEAIDMGLKNITFSGGEPLLNPELNKFAEYFMKNSINMSMETNGILLSKKQIISTVKNNGIHCAISIDGLTPETHNNHRGNKNAFMQTVKSIKELEKEKLKYQLIMSISKFNYSELIPLMNWIKEDFKYCKSFKINIINELGRAEKMKKDGLLFEPEELSKVTEDIATLVGNYPFKIILHVNYVFFSIKNLMLKYSCGGYCGFINSLSILANGNISICSLGKQMNKYIFGHVSTIDLKNMWERTPILNEIQSDFHIKLKGVCRKCIFRKKCKGGCRATALCAYGDIFAPFPTCQDYYDSGKFPKTRLIEL